MNTFEEWIDEIIRRNELCSAYVDKVNDAVSNKQIFDVVTDSNGMSYLPSMDSKGFGLPKDLITGRFGKFINGRCVVEHKTKNQKVYTSAIYCDFYSSISCFETLLTVLWSECTINVKECHFCRIYIDKNSKVKINCPSTSKAIVHYWGEEPSISGNVELIKEK